jgi:hypothetical protein
MSPAKEDEFKNKTISQIQDKFFRQDLALFGEYQYQQRGINTVRNAVILFQFANRILAQGRFRKSIPSASPVDGKYHGTLYFDPRSIHIFPEALGLAQIREFWPEVAQFKNAKPILDGDAYPLFEKKYVKNPYSRLAVDIDLGPAKKIRSVTTRYVRDTQKTQRVKSLHSYQCQILDCPFPSTLPDGSDYAEGHHLKPLGHKGPDHESNILCLCAYHHVAFDMGAVRALASQLRRVDGHALSKKFIDYHNRRIFGKGQ